MSVLPNAQFDPADTVHLAAFTTALRGTSRARVLEGLALAISAEPCNASPEPLSAVYGEVGLLRALLLTRIAIRDLAAATDRFIAAGVSLHNQDLLQTMWKALAKSLINISEHLPDPVFTHLASIVEQIISGSLPTIASLPGELLTEITEILLRVQEEVLQNSKSLQERCTHITIQFNTTFPFCVTH